MIRLFLLNERQMARISPHLPLSHGVPRVDDRRVVSGIVYVNRKAFNGRMRPRPTGRTRRSTTASSGGAGWAFSIASSRPSRAKAPGLIAS
jgi:transposase